MPDGFEGAEKEEIFVGQINMKDIKWQRYILLLIGLFISGVGVAITKKGELGVSPVSSVANILNLAIPKLSMGSWLNIWNCFLIFLQILILRKDFKWIQLLQIVVTCLFGYFTDLGTLLITNLNTDEYIVRLLCVIIGTTVLGLGISMTVHANIIMNAGEAFVKAVSDKTKIEFGNVKIIFDISCVVLSIIVSVILFQGDIKGTREGTIIAAFFNGICVKFFTKILFGKKAENVR